jgi:hypothetical protein
MAGVVPARVGTEETRATILRAQAGAEDICATHEALMAIGVSTLGSGDEAALEDCARLSGILLTLCPRPSYTGGARCATQNAERWDGSYCG